MMNPLTQPLTVNQVKEIVGDDGRLIVVLAVPFDLLIDSDLEGLNDYCDEHILPGPEANPESAVGSILEDIHYEVVGHVPADERNERGQVLLKVTAGVDIYS